MKVAASQGIVNLVNVNHEVFFVGWDRKEGVDEIRIELRDVELN